MPLSLYDLNINKADLNVVSTTNDGLMSITDKTKLDGIASNATKIESSVTNGNIKINGVEKTIYTHPINHTASMITDDSTHRFVTDSEKTTWNEKASTAIATGSINGLMSAADKTKLNEISTKATSTASSSVNGNIKVDGNEITVYTHPANHSASMITDDSTHRFVTDSEKSTWNGKLDKTGGTLTGALTINSDLTINRILSKYTIWGATGDGGAAIVNSNETTYQALVIAGNSSKGDGIRRVKLFDEVTIGGTLVTNNIQMNANSTLTYNGTTIIDNAGKVWGAVYNDLAEGFIAADINGLEPGDVLEQTPQGVKKSSKFESNAVVGVYSDTYGFCLGADGETGLKEKSLVPIGLAGKVKVKVTGTAKIGDLLVASDISGVAVVNNNAKLGTIIGKVLQEKTSMSIERINMMILNM